MGLIPAVSLSKTEELCLDPVATGEGPVAGINDGGVCAYKGIPYAGPRRWADLRWRAPQPPEKHDRVLNAARSSARNARRSKCIPLT